ncbi:SIMPL domain-containing protein [Teredinibacter haidensis]|uniref:SIMPL domain-containing protein n=1 Tax=Teredinibacter haidensis TaxID=2731755 RepID=UPI0009FAEF35|nr:SIMPL domain-containing protein [Teredinibacter haidensis]
MIRLVVTVILLTASLCYAAPEIKGYPEDLRGFLYPKETLVTINDSAEKTAYSDEADINLVITTEKERLSQSLKANTTVRENVRMYLIDKGFKAETIKNSKFSTSPQYGWFGKKPNAFKVVNRMTIKITSEQQLQDIATIADELTEVEISSTLFSHSKKDEFQEVVKQQALDKILAKKRQYEKSLGIKLIPVSFRELGVGMQATEGAQLVEEVVVAAVRSGVDYDMKRKGRVQQTGSSFDEVKYHANMQVEFRVE